MKDRLYFMDSLRGFTILLVVIFHLTMSYAELAPVQKAFIRLDSVPEAYKGFFTVVMALLNGPSLNSIMFFIAGFFAFGTYQKRGCLSFLKEKLIKLGIPYLGGFIILAPLTQYIVNRSWGENGNFPQYWLREFFLPGSITPQHLWFIGILFIFFIISMPVFTLLQKRKQETIHKRCARNIIIILFLIITFFLYFGMNCLYKPYNFINIFIIRFPPAVLPFYAAYFALGVYASFQKWFYGEHKEYIYPWAILYMLSLILYFGTFIIIPETREENHPLMAFAFTVLVFSGLMLLMTVFKKYANKTSKFISWFSKNSYGAYIIHYFIVLWVVYLMREMPLPIIIKYIAQCIFLPCIIWILSGLLKGYTPLRRIL